MKGNIMRIEMHDDDQNEFTKQRDREHRQIVIKKFIECESYLVIIKPKQGNVFVEMGCNPSDFHNYINCMKQMIEQLERMVD